MCTASSSKYRRFTGFTLVELLLVLAIVTLLVTLIVPSLQQAREAGRRMQCGSKMRQTMVLTEMYYGDFKYLLPWCATETYPGAGTPNPSNNPYLGTLYGPSNLYEAGYISWDTVANPYGNQATPAWENSLRRNYLLMCPSCVVLANPTNINVIDDPGYSATPITKAQYDTADGGYNYYTVSWSPPWWNTTYLSRTFVMSSYYCDLGTAHRESASNNYYDYINRFETSTSCTPSQQLYWIEEWAQAGATLSNFQRGYTDQTNAGFHVPHLNTLNYACQDGHVGMVSRDLMRTTTTNEMLPFRFSK